MARTNPTAVEEMLGQNYDPNTPAADMARYIRHATSIIDRVVTCAAAKGQAHTTDELLDLETLLAAHYYSLNDPLYTSRSTGKASGSFNVRNYKEEAFEADFSGCLRQTMKGTKARLVWLGKRPSAQTNYEQRD